MSNQKRQCTPVVPLLHGLSQIPLTTVVELIVGKVNTPVTWQWNELAVLLRVSSQTGAQIQTVLLMMSGVSREDLHSHGVDNVWRAVVIEYPSAFESATYWLIPSPRRITWTAIRQWVISITRHDECPLLTSERTQSENTVINLVVHMMLAKYWPLSDRTQYLILRFIDLHIATTKISIVCGDSPLIELPLVMINAPMVVLEVCGNLVSMPSVDPPAGEPDRASELLDMFFEQILEKLMAKLIACGMMHANFEEWKQDQERHDGDPELLTNEYDQMLMTGANGGYVQTASDTHNELIAKWTRQWKKFMNKK